MGEIILLVLLVLTVVQVPPDRMLLQPIVYVPIILMEMEVLVLLVLTVVQVPPDRMLLQPIVYVPIILMEMALPVPPVLLTLLQRLDPTLPALTVHVQTITTVTDTLPVPPARLAL